MPLVMCSSRSIVTFRHRRYCGSHFPSVSVRDRRCAASNCSIMIEVNALVLLPICHTLVLRTGAVPPMRMVPAPTSMVRPVRGKRTLSPAAEMCSSLA